MKHFYRDVPGIGMLAVSRHAQEKLVAAGVPDAVMQRVLYETSLYEDTPDGHGVVWREALGVRLVIVLRPQPFSGAALVVTGFRPQAGKSVV